MLVIERRYGIHLTVYVDIHEETLFTRALTLANCISLFLRQCEESSLLLNLHITIEIEILELILYF